MLDNLQTKHRLLIEVAPTSTSLPPATNGKASNHSKCRMYLTGHGPGRFFILLHGESGEVVGTTSTSTDDGNSLVILVFGFGCGIGLGSSVRIVRCSAVEIILDLGLAKAFGVVLYFGLGFKSLPFKSLPPHPGNTKRRRSTRGPEMSPGLRPALHGTYQDAQNYTQKKRTIG